MERFVLFSYIATVAVISSVSGQADLFNCDPPGNNLPGSYCFVNDCVEAIQTHIHAELDASLSYLVLATHFDDDRESRPGLANFLYGAANEEREHAIMLMDYLNKRGVLNQKNEYTFDNQVLLQEFSNGTKRFFIAEFDKSPSYLKALELAAELEILVTKKIHQLVEKCGEDFHAADFLTEPILAEQHESIRALQGAIQELRNIGGNHITPFHEWLMDKKVVESGL